MMGKSIVFGLILAGICMVSGCHGGEKERMVLGTDTFVLGLDAVRCMGGIAETARLECCARQIEKIISFERFLYGHSCVPKEGQKKETDIYYDLAERKIYFCIEDSTFLYDAQRLSGYDRYGISRIEMPGDTVKT